MLQFDYDSLAALAAVVREGSFDAAAKSMEITQSAVSQRIKTLEQKVGSILIVRGRPCVPTEIGMQLCRHLEQVSLLQFELNNRVSELIGFDDDQAATIRVSVNNDSLATWFPAVIKRATTELSMLLDVLPDDQEHTEGSLISGDSLAAVTSSDKPIPGCVRIDLGSMDYTAVASKTFFEDNFSEGVNVATMANRNALAFDRKDNLPAQWMNASFGQTLPTKTVFVPSYEGYLECCRTGVGWGMMPLVSVEDLLETGELVELIPNKHVGIPLSWQASTQSSEILRRLGEIVLQEASKSLKSDSTAG